MNARQASPYRHLTRTAVAALALLGTAGAWAQSSVTIYGLIDIGVVKGNGGTAANPFALGTSKAWTLQERSSSRLGFRGTEDLGGGLSAQFQIEHRFRPDTGAVTNPTFWHGRSYVQLTHKALGAVYGGREYSPAYWPAYFTDPAGWDGVGTLGTHQYAGFRSTGGIRTNNTVGWRSPNWGGLSVAGAVSLGEGTAGRDTAFNVQYRSGPLYVGAAYERISGGPAANDGDTLANLGASWDFGGFKAMAYIARAETAGGTADNDAVTLAGTAALGPGEAYLSWGRFDPDGDANTQRKIGAGYKLPLSKRTNLYADIGRGSEDGKTDNTAYAFGIKHTF